MSGQLDANLAALACCRSRFEANPADRGILDAMRISAASWGALIGTAAGEPFFSAEEIGVTDVRHVL